MQGIWIEALAGLAEMAAAMNDTKLANDARAVLERTRAATEKTYWLDGRGFYAFATLYSRRLLCGGARLTRVARNPR
jgi:hypothetical protein